MDHSSSLPSLESLQAVLAAYRSGSFSGAANELNITHGAVSRRVKAVERWAGAALFQRHGRGVRLTIEGQRLVRLTEQALEIIAGGASAKRVKREVEIVRVSVVPSFARLWLIPNLHHLEGEPPDLRLECEVTHRFSSLTEIDVAIRYGRGMWREGVAMPLFAETLIPVASPQLARFLGVSPAPDTLLQYPLIHDTHPDFWHIWLNDHGHNYRLRPQDRSFSDYDLALQAAAQGHGLAMMRHPYGSLFLENGSLVKLSDHVVLNPMQFYAVTRTGPRRKSVHRLIERLSAISVS